MPNIRVTWEADFELSDFTEEVIFNKETAKEAAEEALDMIINGTAKCFDVKHEGKKYMIDLCGTDDH